MKITAGKYHGKNIDARPDKTLRPTSGKVREAVFNILRHGRFFKDDRFISDGNNELVEGRRVIDIFCGTGALGIEALSRGATHLTLVDQNARTLSVAQKNIENLGEAANTTFIRSDSTMLPSATIPCKLAFVDPPYGKNLAKPALKSLASAGWLEKGSVIILELGKQDEVESFDNFVKLDERLHNRTRIAILQYSGH